MQQPLNKPGVDAGFRRFGAFRKHNYVVGRSNSFADFMRVPSAPPAIGVSSIGSSERAKDYRVQGLRADSPASNELQVPQSQQPTAKSPAILSGFGRRLSSAKLFFSKNNLVQRLLPAQLSLDCDTHPIGN